MWIADNAAIIYVITPFFFVDIPSWSNAFILIYIIIDIYYICNYARSFHRLLPVTTAIRGIDISIYILSRRTSSIARSNENRYIRDIGHQIGCGFGSDSINIGIRRCCIIYEIMVHQIGCLNRGKKFFHSKK